MKTKLLFHHPVTFYNMIKAVYFLTLLLSPLFALSQAPARPDSLQQIIMKEDCDDKIFFKEEYPATLVNGSKNFEDSLSSFLKERNAFHEGARAVFRFVLTSSKHIFDIREESGFYVDPALITTFLLAHPSMWKPAVQNGRLVCAYVRFTLAIADGQLHISIDR